MLPRPYIIVPLSHTGHGKSQLCNFIIKDLTNTKFEVSPSFDSQTKDPQCELYNRKIDNEVFQLEIIDTAGCGDSARGDEENFQKLINKLKEKKYVDLFLLVFNFHEDRINGPTRDYIKLIGNTFTPTEFYNHLAIVFTHFPENPNEDDKKREKFKTQKVIEVIRDTIGIANAEVAIPPSIYKLDTKIYNGRFIPKFQATIDIILMRMKYIISLIGPIKTENIRYLGRQDRLKEEQKRLDQQKLEFKRLQKLLEEKKKKEDEEMKIREEKIREEEAKNKRDRESIVRDRANLEREKSEFQRKIEKHTKTLENINNKIKEYNIRIGQLNELIKENNSSISNYKRLISEEEWKKWEGTFEFFGGACLSVVLSPLYLAGVKSASYG